MKIFATSTLMALVLGVAVHRPADAQQDGDTQDRQRQEMRQDRQQRADQRQQDQRRQRAGQREQRRDREMQNRRRGDEYRQYDQRQRDQRSGQDARRGQTTGTVVQTKRVGVRGSDRQHLVVLLRTERGNRVAVDLGDVNRLDREAPSRGDQIRVRGRLVRIGDRNVIVGEQLQRRGGRTVRIEPQGPRSDRDRQGAREPRGGLGVALATDPAANGVRIVRVMPGSPAAEAGIQTGDVIMQIDGTNVRNPQELIRAVVRKEPGERVNLTLSRNGQRQQITAQLSEREEALNPAARQNRNQRQDSR